MAGKAGMRRRSEFGTLVKVGERWKASYPAPGGKRVYLGRFRTKAEGRTALNSVQEGMREGRWIDPQRSSQTVADVAALWLASNHDKRANTLATDISAVDNWIVPALGDLPIGKVERVHIEQLVNAWQDGTAPRKDGSQTSVKPPTAHTVRRRYTVLSAIFSYAVVNRWITATPCVQIRLPRITDTRCFPLSDEQVRAIAEATRGDFRPMVWLAAVTGMRWEEAAALRVGDFDLDEGTVTIDETVIRGTDGRPQFSRTKTAAAVRTIPLPADVVKMVEKRIADLGELGERTPERLLWSAPDDPAAPLAANWFRHKIWCEALREVGLYDAKPHRPGFHDLRRAYSTALIVGGVDVKTAQDLMGHADIATTLNIYAKATTESRRNASDVSAARFFPEG